MERLTAVCVGSKVLEYSGSMPISIIKAFDNVVYAKTSKSHLLVITSDSKRSDITVNVDAPKGLQNYLIEGEQLSLIDNSMVGRYADIILSENTYRGALAKGDKNALLSCREELVKAATLLSILAPQDAICDSKGRFFESYKRAINLLSLDNIHQPLLENIGLGSGLTPSFDDFASGFLAIYNNYARLFRRIRIILSRNLILKRTSWLSGSILDYAQHGIVDEDVAHVINSISRGDKNFLLNIQELTTKGHTSGVDTATGIVVAAALLMDSEARGFMYDIMRILGLT
ncbi:MAG: DUF2877 domain-containing protein [Conexivisphaerales archaeon]